MWLEERITRYKLCEFDREDGLYEVGLSACKNIIGN